MEPLTIAAIFAVGLVLVVIAFVIAAIYNDVVALRQRVDKAWSNIDVALKQRHDMLPALIDAVRGVLAFERNTLAEVTRLRAAYSPTAPIHDQAVTSEATTAAVRSLFAVVERYPALKGGDNVLDLQNEIERIENVIADRRELYNDQVYRLNTTIAQVPAVLLAGLFGWKAREFFLAEPLERQAPSANLIAD